ncbi:MAG: anti-sigma factor antagonist [Treponematales bacterium]
MTNNDIVAGFDEGEGDENPAMTLRRVAAAADCLVVGLSGRIGTGSAGRFQRRVRRALDAGFVRLIFHCGGLERVSAAAAGVFAVFLKTARSHGGDVVLSAVPPAVSETLRLLGFAGIFPFADTPGQSLAFLQDGAGAPFPQVFVCPVCSKKVKAPRPGRFRCPSCAAVITVDRTARVFLG